MLAMLRWTKTEPGGWFRMVDSGTRESEQPSQRMVGDWPLERVGRKSGFSELVFSAQDLLEERAAWKASVVSYG